MASVGTVEVDVKGNIAPLVNSVKGALSGQLSGLAANIGVNTSAFSNGVRQFSNGVRQAAAGAERDLAGVAGAAGSAGASLVRLGAVSAAAGTAGLAALRGLSDAYEDASKETLKLQRLTGGTAEDMSRLRFIAQQSGLGFDALATSIVRLSRSATGGGADTLKALGVEMRDSAGNSRAYTAILGDLAAKFASMPNGIEKNALAMKLFGRAGADLIPILNKGSDGFAELAAKSDEFGATLTSRDTAGVIDHIKRQRDLAASIAAFKVQIGREVYPVFDALATLATKLATAFGVLPGPVKTAASALAVGSAAAAALGGAMTLVGAGLSAFGAAAARGVAGVRALTGANALATASTGGLGAASGVAAAGVDAEGVAAATAARSSAALTTATSASSAAMVATGAAAATGAAGLEAFAAANASAIAAVNARGAAGAAASALGGIGAKAGMASRAVGGLKTALSGATGQLLAATVAYTSWSWAISENSKQMERNIGYATQSAEELSRAVNKKTVGDFLGPVQRAAEALAELDQVGAMNAWQKIFGYDEGGNRAKVATAQFEELKTVLSTLSPEQGRKLLDALRDQMIALGVPTDQVKSKLEELYELLGDSGPFDTATENVEGLSGALTDASKGLQGLVSVAQSAADPFLSLREAQLSAEDAQDAVADASAKYTAIVQRNTDAVRAARDAVTEAGKALQEARAEAGPGSEAADSASDAVSRAEDGLRKLRQEQAEQDRANRQRNADIAAGKEVTTATFDKDYAPDIERATRELGRAKAKRDQILSGNTDAVRSAQDRLRDSQSKLNDELGKVGPNSDAARRAQNDLEQAQLAATRSAEAQQMAQAKVSDTLAAFPDAAAAALGYLGQLRDQGLITKGVYDALAGSFAASAAALGQVAAQATAASGAVAGLGVGGTVGGLSMADRYSGTPRTRETQVPRNTVPAENAKAQGFPSNPRDGQVSGMWRYSARDKKWHQITLPGYAIGGYIAAPQIAQLHSNELVLPLSNPQRTNELMTQAGLRDNQPGFVLNLTQHNVGLDPERTADATTRAVKAAALTARVRAGAL